MSTNRYTFAVTWYFLRVNVGRQTVLKIQCIVNIMSSSVLFFQTFSEMFPVAAHWIHGHVWRLGIHVSMYDGLPSRRSLLRHSRGLSDDPSTRQVRAVRSVTLQEEQQAAPSRHAQKPFSSTFTDGTIIKVQTEQIQTYWNMWGSNWLHCCWLVEASDWQMVLPITNHLYYLILRLLVNDRSINRVIKYWCDLWTRLNDQLLLFLNRFLHLKVPDIYFVKTWLKKKISISDFTSSSCLNWRVKVTNYTYYYCN